MSETAEKASAPSVGQKASSPSVRGKPAKAKANGAKADGAKADGAKADGAEDEKKEPKKSMKEKCGDCCHFVYNKDTGEVLGRGGLSWLKITIFYLVFFAFLAAFFSAMLMIFYVFVNTGAPTYFTGIHGKGDPAPLRDIYPGVDIVGNNPALNYIPGFRLLKKNKDNQWEDDGRDPSSSSIEISLNTTGNKAGGPMYWAEQLEAYFRNTTALQNKAKTEPNCATGDGINKQKIDPKDTEKKGLPCKIKTPIDSPADFGPCTMANKYGYAAASPCVLVRINRIINWVPFGHGGNAMAVPTYKADVKQKQGYAKEELKVTVSEGAKTLIKEGKGTDPMKSAWIICEGENPADRENIGPIAYYPDPAPMISKNYFPFLAQPGYASPFVMVHFQRPMPGVLIKVECKLYAKSSYPDKYHGSVRFNLMIAPKLRSPGPQKT